MARIFFISDNHFGSKEVIETFHRIDPSTGELFQNADEMDAFMMERWNKTVKPTDTVFSIGDFTWAGDWKRPPRYWWNAPDTYQQYLNQLNGYIVLIHGNHDPWIVDSWDVGGNIIHNKGRMFYLTHIPEFIPKNWTDWAIHGHHHWIPDNKNPERTLYPFIDGKYKNINVACEVVDYTPVSFDWILSLDIDTIWRMETINSKPER